MTYVPKRESKNTTKRNQYNRVVVPDYINPILCKVVKETRFGRIIRVEGLIENHRFDLKGKELPDPYFVAHSWNDEDHLSWHFEGFFQTTAAAEIHLENL